MRKEILKVKKELLAFEMEDLNYSYDDYLPEELKVYADSLEEAVDIASKEMNLHSYYLEYEVLQKGFIDLWNFRRIPYIVHFYTNQGLSQGIDPVQRLKDSTIASYMEQFKIQIYTNGVFLTSIPEKNKHKKIKTQFICDKLAMLGIERYSYKEVEKICIEERNVPIKIAQWNLSPNSVDSKVQIKISEDKMKASIYIIPPKECGRHVKKEQIFKLLKQENVNYGIVEEEVEYCLSNNIYYQYHDVAFAFNPNSQYQNTYVHYNVNKQKKVKFSENERQPLFWDSSIIENVKKGQVLAKIVFPQTTNYQILVTGKKIPIKNVLKTKTIPKLQGGKGTELSGDGISLQAKYDGRVIMRYGRLYVEDIYYIYSNLKVGSKIINFNGSVIAKGSILDNNTINAQNRIHIKGNTYKVNLTAKDEIILAKGISGKISNCVYSKEDSVYTQFVQKSSVYANEHIIIEKSVINSYLYAKNTIQCIEGRKSQIFGGETFVGQSLIVNNLGNNANVKTNVFAGCNVSKYFLLHKLNPIIKNITNTLSNQQKQKDFLNRIQKNLGYLSDKEKNTYIQVSKQIEILTSKIDNLQMNKKSITSKLYEDANRNALVHVLGTLYAGVTIQIHKVAFSFEKNLQHVTVYLDQDDTIRTKTYASEDKFIFFREYLSNLFD